MEKSIREIRQKLKDSKKFWGTLPYNLCNNTMDSVNESARCWSGIELGIYNESTVLNQALNTESNRTLSTSRQTNKIATEMYYLKQATENLRKASSGQDVIWAETEKEISTDKGPVDDDDFDITSGDGSGDGSGEFAGPTTYSESKNNSNKSINFVTSTENILTFNPSTDDIKSSEPTRYGTTKKPKKSSAPKQEMSLRKALFLYLFPIYVTWFSVIFD